MARVAELMDYPEALTTVLSHAWLQTAIEDVGLNEADGRVLAQDILADRDLPPFHRAAMDGYAVRTVDLDAGATLPCVGEVRAGAMTTNPTPAGSCIAIATGAAVPAWFDAVVPHEWTDRSGDAGGRVHLDRKPQVGHAIHTRASDAHRGDVLVRAGQRLGFVEVGLAATCGRSTLQVHQRPRVTVFSSGDEVVPIETTPRPEQIRNSNLPMMRTLVARLGGHVVAGQHLMDESRAAAAAIEAALDTSDVIVTIGGISAGTHDPFRNAIRGTILLQGAAIQPGRPIQVAIARDGKTPIVSLPGNPVSAFVTACLFLWPLLDRCGGCTRPLAWTRGTLGDEARRHPTRRRFRPATLDSHGQLNIPQWHGSGDLAHAQGTTGLVDVAPGDAPLDAGAPVQWLPLP